MTTNYIAGLRLEFSGNKNLQVLNVPVNRYRARRIPRAFMSGKCVWVLDR